jgi:hypothetical protein
MLQSIRIAAMDVRQEMVVTKDHKLLPDAFQFLGIVSCSRIANNRGVFKL